MVYQSPTGARDLLPLDVAQKRWIEDRIQQVFHQWGYHRIITSTLERLETLMAGGAIDRSTVLHVQDSPDEPLGLRPELTASIARAVATRMVDATYPLRLYYTANVFRRPDEGSDGRRQESYQAGVELLGIGSDLANAEMLLLITDCLRSLELPQWSLLLGEAGVTRSLLATFPPEIRETVRRAIVHLDRVGLETLPMPEELRTLALVLLDLRGEPTQVFQTLAHLNLDDAQTEALEQLRALIELVRSRDPNLPIILDLSLIRTFDYYTGIVFEAIVPSATGQPQVVGQGGRYDQLLGLYHPQGKTLPGIGFSLQIEALHQLLAERGKLPQKTIASDWVVVADGTLAYDAAIAHAQELRNSYPQARIELELGTRDRGGVQDYARHRRIRQIAWVKEDGSVETVEC